MPFEQLIDLENSFKNPSKLDYRWTKFSDLTKTNADDILHFSGANGFPVACYEHFLDLFEDSYDVQGMDPRPSSPIRQNPPNGFRMHDFANDLIQGMQRFYKQPVIGMGHSLGGQVTLIAALQQPDLFSKLIIIEPASLPNPYIDLVYRHIPKKFLDTFFPFIKGSENRRKVWGSREEFMQRYKHHATFKHFTEEALLNYAQHGLFKRDDGQYELIFDPTWESYIFRNIEFMWKFLRKIHHPTLVIRAEHSNLYSQQQFEQYNSSLPPHITHLTIPNTHHLLPFEHPTALYETIETWLKHH